MTQREILQILLLTIIVVTGTDRPKGQTRYIRERGGTRRGETDKETTTFISKENDEMELRKSTKGTRLTKSSHGRIASSHYTAEISFRRDNKAIK